MVIGGGSTGGTGCLKTFVIGVTVKTGMTDRYTISVSGSSTGRGTTNSIIFFN